MLNRKLEIWLLLAVACWLFGGQLAIGQPSSKVLDRQPSSDSLEMYSYLRQAEELLKTENWMMAQQMAVDAWEIAIAIDHPTAKARSLVVMAEVATSHGEINQSLRFFLEALRLYETQQQTERVAALNMRLGVLYERLDFFQKAAEYYGQAYVDYQKINQLDAQERALEKASEMAYKAGDHDTALTFYSRLLYFFRTHSKPDGIRRTLQRLVQTSTAAGYHANALEFHNQLLKQVRTEGDSVAVAAVFNNMGFAHMQLRNYDKALDYFISSHRLDMEKGGAKSAKTSTMVNIGVAFQNLGKTEDALYFLNMALETRLKEKDWAGASSVEHILSTIYLQDQDYYNARLHGETALKLAERAKEHPIRRDVYLTFSKIHQGSGDYQRALDYYKRHLALRDSLLINSRLKEQDLLRLQEDLDKRDQELRLKLAEEERRDLLLRQQSLKNETLEKENNLLRAQSEIQLYVSQREQLEREQELQQQILARRQLESQRQEQEIGLLRTRDSIQQLKINERDLARQRDADRFAVLERENELKQIQLDRVAEARKWSQWVAACFAVIFLLIVLGLINTRRVNRQLAKQKGEIQQKNIELELKTEEMLAQADTLKEANEEISRQRDALQETLEQLGNMQTQLVNAEKMASLGQLTAGIAHEINNPINFVSANVGPLRRDLQELSQLIHAALHLGKNGRPLADQLLDFQKLGKELDALFLLEEVGLLLNGIEEGASRTKEIVLGLRNFSRLDEHDFKMAYIQDGIHSTLTVLGSKLRDHVHVDLDIPDLPPIECLPGQLNQVFMNILNNAVQAIEGSGTIFVKARDLGRDVQISIRDTGKGMSEQVKSRIFEPFFTTKDVGEGTGLGLSISYGIIEQHKGKIEVRSEVGKGSEFVITLPKKQA